MVKSRERCPKCKKNTIWPGSKTCRECYVSKGLRAKKASLRRQIRTLERALAPEDILKASGRVYRYHRACARLGVKSSISEHVYLEALEEVLRGEEPDPPIDMSDLYDRRDYSGGTAFTIMQTPNRTPRGGQF